jgi:hypothetical protein
MNVGASPIKFAIVTASTPPFNPRVQNECRKSVARYFTPSFSTNRLNRQSIEKTFQALPCVLSNNGEFSTFRYAI